MCNLNLSFRLLVLLPLLAALSSCEDVISLELGEGETLLVVDAFLNDKPGVQTIRLSRSVPYLSEESPPALSGARVSVVDLYSGREFVFRERVPGHYQRRMSDAGTFGIPGNAYELRILFEGETYTAQSRVHPVPLIDSIVYGYEEESPFQDEGYQAYFIAFDLDGQTDYYFIRSYKNGVLRSRNTDFQVCIDAAYAEGAADGLQFIEPVADFTPGDDPYQPGDSASVEIASIDKRTHGFLTQVLAQSSNAGLFATPPANVRSNIESVSTSPRLKPAGWFAVSAVSSAGTLIKPE